jgi:hypothetical protein
MATFTRLYGEEAELQRHSVTISVLSLVAILGLMAFSTVGAQAEITFPELGDGGKTGKFAVAGLTTLAKPGVTFEANQMGRGTLLVPGRGFDILCEVGIVKGEFASESEAHEIFGVPAAQFSKCTTWVNVVPGLEHKEKIPCTVAEPIQVTQGIALPKKHESAPYVLLEEKGGVAFTTIKFVKDEICPLPLSNTVTGSTVGKVINSGTVQPSIEFNEKIQKLFQSRDPKTGKFISGDKLNYGTFDAYVDAFFLVRLTDAEHAVMTIAVI